ncbi:hypothetical protein [Cypionkella sp.]|nr:hypothetical protein [Cypionkella sp.]MDZ4393872.1 hypothetical protein [Cypionkella sp.]
MIEITPEAALTATDETQIATLLARCFDTPSATAATTANARICG